MKKKSITALVAAVIIIIVAASSVAYFNSKDTADNVFTVGDVDITLTEPGWDPEGDHIFSPGAEFKKDPTVTNTGDRDAYVRINMTVTDGAFFQEHYDQLLQNYDPDVWQQDGDPDTSGGVYKASFIFHKKLAPGESTAPLFTGIKFSEEIEQSVLEELGDTLEMTFTADAIQAEGFDDPEEAFRAYDNN